MKWGKWRVHNYSIIIYMTIIVSVITLSLGILVFRLYFNSMKQTKSEGDYEKYYAMIVNDRDSSFWQSVYEGAFQQAQRHNAYLELSGTQVFQNYSRNDLMHIAIHSGVDGIIVEADESEEMTTLIKEAMEKNIPVITVYGDNADSERISYVGVNSFNLGKEYGLEVVEAWKEKKQPMTAAVLVSANAQDSGQSTLCTGVRSTIRNEGITAEEIDVQLVAVDTANAFAVEETIRDLFTNYEVPDVIICLSELTTTCVYQAVVDFNKVGDVEILGYYDSETIRKGIKRGVIDATFAVDTKRMGRYAIEALEEYGLRGYTSQYFATEVTLINQENIESYEEETLNGN